MNTTSLELGRELYKLSGWKPTDWQHGIKDGQPLYDLGYLLRKLPNYIEYWDGGNEAGYLQLIHWSTHWSCGYEDVQGSSKSIMIHLNDTPEDAACKLAIELFKQGVLEKAA